MKLLQDSIGSIRFYHRPGFSDLKTFEEVIGRKTYLKRGLKIGVGERWMDCGGNVGAFALLACKLGAKVTVYEPDPYNVDMIKRNLRLNKFEAVVKQAALVHDQRKTVTLFIGNNSQVWRNSIVRKWNDKGIKVPCLNFDEEAKNFDACKMDIEGAEYAVTRHMVTQGVACWVDYWEFEGHAMYTPDTAKYRPVDAVLPWLLRGCPGQPVQMVLQDWYTEDYKVWSAWNETDNKECPLPMIVD